MPSTDPSALDLERLVSPAKFAPFLTRTKGDHAKAKRLYVWNVELSECFLGPTAMLEVAMRNAMHREICQYFQVDPRVGWHHLALQDRPRIHLLDRHRERLVRARDKLARNDVINPTGDDIVGATTLGFWIALADKGIPRQEGGKLDYFQRLWLPFLHKAFPGYQTPRSPGPLRGRLNDFERLRNRIAHHERIYNMKADVQIDNIVTIARWIDPSLGDYIEGAHSITDCVNAQQQALDDGECCL